MEKLRRHLRESSARHVLVGAANDPSALGAVRAFQEAGRVATCAIVGQNAEPDARAELREERTPFIGSVAFFPERYGAGSSSSLSTSSPTGDTTRHLHSPPADHAGQRRSLLCERRPPQPGDVGGSRPIAGFTISDDSVLRANRRCEQRNDWAGRADNFVAPGLLPARQVEG